jgi:hypothetical protein
MINENETLPEDIAQEINATWTRKLPLRARLFKIVRKCIARFLKHQKNCMARIESTIQKNAAGFERCVLILKGCQEQVARVLDHEIERHALNPAIETVALLVDEISRLEKLAKEFARQHQPCSDVQQIISEIAISNQIAADRLCHLDIIRIAPSNGEMIDPKSHAITAVTNTEDTHLNGLIDQTLTPGILYRGTVLRTARVKVFKVVRKEPE